MENLVNEPKTARGRETFDRICQEAEKLFYKKGYYATSINNITENADVAPGTFYIYFKDKYSLYKYLLLTYSHKIRKVASMASEGEGTRKEKERAGLLAFLKFARENKHAYMIIWESLYIDSDLFKDYYETFAERYINNMKKPQEDGEILDDDLTTISYALMGITSFMGLRYVIFEESTDEELEKVADSVINILENGILK